MIGVEDDGTPQGIKLLEMEYSLATLFIMARNLTANLQINQVLKGIDGYICEAQVSNS
jgi:GTPase